MRKATQLKYLIAAGLMSSVLTGAEFSVVRQRVAAGGGAAAGGPFQVKATAGQSDGASQASGDKFGVAGGLWSLLVTVQTPGAPELRIDLTAAHAPRISWPSPSTGWRLQRSTGLTNWVTASEPITDNGVTKSITVTSPVAQRFYRLIKP